MTYQTMPTQIAHEVTAQAADIAAAPASPPPAHIIQGLAPRRDRRPPDSRKPHEPAHRERLDRTIPLSERSMDILKRRRCWMPEEGGMHERRT